MRDDLDGLAEVVAPPLVGEDGLVDLAACQVVRPRENAIREALVVSQIEIGLGPVGEHVDLSVLERVHRAGIHVEVGIELLKRHTQAPMFQKGPQGSTGQTLAERTDHTTRHENILHG